MWERNLLLVKWQKYYVFYYIAMQYIEIYYSSLNQSTFLKEKKE